MNHGNKFHKCLILSVGATSKFLKTHWMFK